MKKHSLTIKGQLTFKRETIRKLTEQELRTVIGGLEEGDTDDDERKHSVRDTCRCR